MGKIRLIEKNEADSFASIKNQNVSEYGVIASGIGYSYAIDIITKYSLHVPILKIGMTNPMPESTITEFLEEHGNIIVIEELDPFIEGKIREIAQMNNIPCNIHGKMDGVMPDSDTFWFLTSAKESVSFFSICLILSINFSLFL